MSHRLYHTEAILLGSRPYGEANRLLYLLTPDLGLVLTAVQGVRQASSKLRGHLLDYCHLRISLVRGRGIWRLTGAEVITDQISIFNSNQQTWWWRLCHLARRLIHGEESHPELFTRFLNWATDLGQTTDLPELRHQGLRHHLELLHLLGYVPYQEFVKAAEVKDDGQLVGQINRALEYSQL